MGLGIKEMLLIGIALLTARSTSRLICADSLAWDEKTRTMARAPWIASSTSSCATPKTYAHSTPSTARP